MASGIYPREIIPGVIWDECCEVMFDDLVSKFSASKGWELDVCEKEATFVVEQHAHNVFYREQMMLATKCVGYDSERALYASWVDSFGKERARRLGDAFKSPKSRLRALGYGS